MRDVKILVYFSTIDTLTCIAMDGPVVHTSLGKIQGTVYTTDRGEEIYAFLGVPYAKPPVGKLRFKDPEPAEPWRGVRSAVKSPPTAPSLDIMGQNLIEGGSEDCLFVQIYTPEPPTPGKNLPVMALIHGGGFVRGSGNIEWHGPDYLVPKGVILVSISYRINAMGFLSFQNQECPGNFGLKDQSLALKWIQQNIQSFGGDPKNVTIFGESAGAASVTYQMLSPLSKGLFQKAIAQSGSALSKWAFTSSPSDAAFVLAKRLGYDGSDPHDAFETIRKSSGLEILTKSVGILGELEGVWHGDHFMDYTFVPTAEPKYTPNAFLTKTPEQAVRDGDFLDIPIIAGVCADEAIFALFSPDYVPDCTDDVEFQKMLPKGYAELGSEKMAEASKKLKEFFFPNGVTQKGFVRALSFKIFVRGVFKTIEAQAKNPNKTSPVYAYVFKACREDSGIKRLLSLPNDIGIGHGEDLEFFFLDKGGMMPVPPIAAGTRDDQVKENATKMWTDFAKTGNPSSSWPVADAAKGLPYVEIAETITRKNNFFAEDNKFWDEIYAFLSNE